MSVYSLLVGELVHTMSTAAIKCHMTFMKAFHNSYLKMVVTKIKILKFPIQHFGLFLYSHFESKHFEIVSCGQSHLRKSKHLKLQFSDTSILEWTASHSGNCNFGNGHLAHILSITLWHANGTIFEEMFLKSKLTKYCTKWFGLSTDTNTYILLLTHLARLALAVHLQQLMSY